MLLLAVLTAGSVAANFLELRHVFRLEKRFSEELAEKMNPNWILLSIPENCHSIFVCMDKDIFDEKIKHGMISLHDDRNHAKEMSIPCFIGYVPTSDLTHLDTLAGFLKTK